MAKCETTRNEMAIYTFIGNTVMTAFTPGLISLDDGYKQCGVTVDRPLTNSVLGSCALLHPIAFLLEVGET